MLSVSFGPDSPFFLVLDPTPGCKLDDIVLDCSLRKLWKLGELFEAGALDGRNPELHAVREDAEMDGQRRIHEIIG